MTSRTSRDLTRYLHRFAFKLCDPASMRFLRRLFRFPRARPASLPKRLRRNFDTASFDPSRPKKRGRPPAAQERSSQSAPIQPVQVAPARAPAQQLHLPLEKPRVEHLPAAAQRKSVLKGKCYVIDGDTIVIKKQHIRIAGIDAPELEHPFGQPSKWAMVRLCKGQVITADVKDELSYGRLVATCYLPDGRDIAAELVKLGLAVDWPKYSGGRYRHLEPEGIRKKLWRCDARQKGRMPPVDYGAARFR